MPEFRSRRLSAMKMTVAIGKSVGGSEPILRKQAITVDGLKFFPDCDRHPVDESPLVQACRAEPGAHEPIHGPIS